MFARVSRVVSLVLLLVSSDLVSAEEPEKVRPLMREFIGLNVHTVQFKPELYQPVTRVLRDYHPFSWDVGKETDFKLEFPFARNRVDWGSLYGSWREAGYDINASVMFDDTLPDKWVNLPRDARSYAVEFAKEFGPSGQRKTVSSVEIGNEPGKYDDESYRTLFEHAAKGFRQGDPRLKIVTCNMMAQPSGDYHKSLELLKGFESLYDVINTHAYAMAEQWPTWRRSYPEDPKIDYLKDIAAVIAWRDKHAPGKPVWLTEFGWDASNKSPATEGPFKDWVDVTDEQQAQYLVRSLLVFSAMDLERAYIYWFNDSDEPSLHASSGLTRNDQPKPAFHAVAHLQSTLGPYRYSRTLTHSPGKLSVYEYTHGEHPKQKIWAAWSPTGSNHTETIELTSPKAPPSPKPNACHSLKREPKW